MKKKKPSLSNNIWPKRVGLTYDDEFFAYKNIIAEETGWIDPLKYLPYEYDMVELNLENKIPIKGWLTGNHWDALRLKKTDKVLGWKCLQGDQYAS